MPPAAPAPTAATTACLSLVGLLAAAVFLSHPQRPAGMVWDEGYYATSTQRYAEGRAQFGTHPPLGPMLLAAGEALLRPNAGLDTGGLGQAKHVTGEQLPAGYSFAGMRLASAAAATLAAGVLFLLALQLSRSRAVALVATNLFVFDNALATHLRAAHLDAFQLLFVLLALWAFASAAMRPQAAGWREAAIGAAGALALLVKLNAAWLLLPAAALVLRRLGTAGAGAATRTAARMLAAGLLATALVMAAHLAFGRHPPDPATVAGRQDAAFVDGAYRRYLEGAQPLSPTVLWSAGAAYARFMAADIDGMGLHDDNGSTPAQWLRLQKPIGFRWDSDGVRTAYVQLVPNPVGWIVAWLAPLALAVVLWRRPAGGGDGRGFVAATLLAAWLGWLVLHQWLVGQRVMYLYHAFGGLLLGFLLAVLAWTLAAERWRALRRHAPATAAAFTALQLAAFLWLAPLSFHRPLDAAACARRNLPLSVVECRP